jgi:hypothetical protein
MTKEPVQFDLVTVEWMDTGARAGMTWATAEELVKEAATNDGIVVTVGYLLHNDDQFLLLAQSHDTHFDNYLNTHQVMKSAVRKVVKL